LKHLLLLCLFFSSSAFPSDVLLAEYLKEIDPYTKQLKEAKAFLQPLVDKQMSGKKLTNQELEQSTMIGCYNEKIYRKLHKISTKPKYKNLEKAKKTQKASSAILKNFSVNPASCTKYGLN
jgi:hypothetical protein